MRLSPNNLYKREQHKKKKQSKTKILTDFEMKYKTKKHTHIHSGTVIIYSCMQTHIYLLDSYFVHLKRVYKTNTQK